MHRVVPRAVSTLEYTTSVRLHLCCSRFVKLAAPLSAWFFYKYLFIVSTSSLTAHTFMEQQYNFEAFPGTSLTVIQFQGVQNGAELRDAIVAKKLAADAAFIDRDTVPDIFLLQIATFKALVAQVCDLYLQEAVWLPPIVTTTRFLAQAGFINHNSTHANFHR